MSRRAPRPRPGAFRIADHRGGWTRVTPWRVTTAAGEPHDLSGMQEALRRAIGWRIGHGAHRATLADLAELVGAEHRGSVWHAIRRLRSLNLVAYRAPIRGRNGTFVFWLPRANAARLAARLRAERWPSRSSSRPDRRDPSANVVTPTAFGGNLTREGIRRAWRARERSGRPPVAAAPRRGASPAAIRARSRPWPPRYVGETCPRTGHRVRLELGHSEMTSAGDFAATWSGRCRRDRRAIAVGLVLTAVASAGAERVGEVLDRHVRPVASSSTRRVAAGSAALAAAIIADGVPSPIADRLRVDYLGWRRRDLALPVDRPALTSDAGGMDPLELEAIAWSEFAADLAVVSRSRELEPPGDEAPAARTVTDGASLEAVARIPGRPVERANPVDGRRVR